jgi:cytochrome c553
MKVAFKRAVGALAGLLVIAAGSVGAYAYLQSSRFEASLDKVYDVPLPNITRSTDPAVIARGKHLSMAVGACASTSCHGADLSGGKPIDIGPLGTFVGPNITGGSLGAAYSDGEMARLIRHGVKKDGRSVRFMPVEDFDWLPDDEVTAIISYLRAAPPVDRPSEPTVVRTLGKVLDRRGDFVVDVARRIDHQKTETVPPPGPDAAYGSFLVRMCTGCHGKKLSGGRIPGAPSSLPIPSNLTTDGTGLRDWSFDDFDRLMRTAVKKDGQTLNPFMPTEAYRNLDGTEMRALWTYLRSLPPTPFGSR